MHRSTIIGISTLLALAVIVPAAAIAALIAPAFAQGTTVDLDPLYQELIKYVVMAVVSLVGLAALWLFNKVQTLTGLNIDSKHRDALQAALENGAKMALGKVIPDRTGLKIDVGNAQIADGINYVLKAVPDALAYFKVTPERLQEMLEAKIIGAAADKGSTLGDAMTVADGDKAKK